MTHTVRVPASTSNLGAGFDCLGLAHDIWLEASLIPGSGPPEYSGTLADLAAEVDLVHVHRSACGATNGHHLRIHSDIPLGRGLGSSAAGRVAALVLERLVRGESIDNDELRFWIRKRRCGTNSHVRETLPFLGSFFSSPTP